MILITRWCDYDFDQSKARNDDRYTLVRGSVHRFFQQDNMADERFAGVSPPAKKRFRPTTLSDHDLQTLLDNKTSLGLFSLKYGINEYPDISLFLKYILIVDPEVCHFVFLEAMSVVSCWKQFELLDRPM